MKTLSLIIAFVAISTVAFAQHDLRWMAGMDYGIPINAYDQSRSVMRGTIPSRQFDLNTGLQYRAFNRIGIELGVGQDSRKLRIVDHLLSTESPGYRAVTHVKNHYLSVFGALQFYVPLPDEDFLVFSGGYSWNFAGGQSLSVSDDFVHGHQNLTVTNQYLGSNHSFFGEIGYNGPPGSHSSLYVGMKVNVGASPLMTGDYQVTNTVTADSYSDKIVDKGSYVALDLKYYLTALHKDKVERDPKPAKEPKEHRKKVDSQPVEVKHILKDTVVVEGRPVIVGQTIAAQNPEITIRVWDAEAIDGDSISLILNGEYILRNEALTATKVDVKARLQPGKNYLVLYAHNQGKYPPNTAAIIVDDGIRKNQIELKSNLKTSGALEITLGK